MSVRSASEQDQDDSEFLLHFGHWNETQYPFPEEGVPHEKNVTLWPCRNRVTESVALKLFGEMKDGALDVSKKCPFCSHLVKAYYSVDEARGRLDAIIKGRAERRRKARLIASDLRALAIRKATVGNFPGAFEIATTMLEGRSKESALAFLSEKMAAAGDFNNAISAAEAISQESYKSYAIRQISIWMASAGLVGEALDLAKKITDDVDKFFVLQEISTNTVEASLLGKVLAVLITIDPIKRIRVIEILKGILGDMSDAGKIDEALEVVKTMMEQIGCTVFGSSQLNAGLYQSDAFSIISDILREAGNFQKAEEVREMMQHK